MLRTQATSVAQATCRTGASDVWAVRVAWLALCSSIASAGTHPVPRNGAPAETRLMNLRPISAVVVTVLVLTASPGHGGEKRQAGDQPKAGTDAENTGQNVRDRSGDTATV